MTKEQSTLFDTRKLKGQKPRSYAIEPPTAAMTVNQTLPAYHAYLSSGGYADTTPDDYVADMKLFGQFTNGSPIKDMQKVDIQQWIAKLKETMTAKTVSRKVSAIGNYFQWLEQEKVLEKNPGNGIHAAKVTSPPPDILFNNECDRLLVAASKDARTYLLVLLLLETGIKTAELVRLQTGDFDFSNKYQPELWVKHGSDQASKDRSLKLPMQVADVYNDYVQHYSVNGRLFPYSERFLSILLNDAAKRADITKPVNMGALRDVCVVRGIKSGEKPETMFEKIGLSPNSYDDARKKYARLTKGAL